MVLIIPACKKEQGYPREMLSLLQKAGMGPGNRPWLKLRMA